MSLLSALAFVLIPSVKPRDETNERMTLLEARLADLSAETDSLKHEVRGLHHRIIELTPVFIIDRPNERALQEQQLQQQLGQTGHQPDFMGPWECTCVPGRAQVLNQQQQSLARRT